VIVVLGVGTIVHSMIDFGISVFIWKPLSNVVHIPYNAKIHSKNKTVVQ
ncbi:MAG: hypothetical protein K0Q85_1327, partial [Caproiciproducens sp.]|nr:hypothetical protein [Caproiciproducens sp.]